MIGKLFSQMCTPGGKLPRCESPTPGSGLSHKLRCFRAFLSGWGPRVLPLAWRLFWGPDKIFIYLAPCQHQQILAQLTCSKAVSPNIPGDAWLWPFDSPGARKRRDDPRCLFYLFTVTVTEHWHGLPRKVMEAPSSYIFKIWLAMVLANQLHPTWAGEFYLEVGTVLLAELFCFKKEEKREGAQRNTSHSPSPAKSTAPCLPECAGAVQNSCLYPPQGTCRHKKVSWVAFVHVHGHLKPRVLRTAEKAPKYLTATSALGPG